MYLEKSGISVLIIKEEAENYAKMAKRATDPTDKLELFAKANALFDLILKHYK